MVFHVDKLLCSSIRELKALDKLDPNDLFYSPLRIHHDNIILSADLCHSYKSGDQIYNDDRQLIPSLETRYGRDGESAENDTLDKGSSHD